MTDEQMWGLIVAAQLMNEPPPFHEELWNATCRFRHAHTDWLNRRGYTDWYKHPIYPDDVDTHYRAALIKRFRPTQPTLL